MERFIMKHSIVHYEAGMFEGWPANGGVWNWGNEVLVCFYRGYYREYSNTHCIDNNRPITIALARSINGGETWTVDTDSSINELIPMNRYLSKKA